MFFAGSTVTIALVSLAVAGIPLVTTMGLMAGIAVVVAVLAALTLLPAALAIAGPRINALRVRPPHRDLRPEAATEQGAVGEMGDDIASHPMIAGLAALAILMPLMIPLLSLNLGQQDTAALSTSTTARRAYDLISESFGPGRQRAADHRGLAGLARQGRRTTRACRPSSRTWPPRPGSRRSPRSRSNQSGTTAYFNAIATTGPAEKATEELVERLRSA